MKLFCLYDAKQGLVLAHMESKDDKGRHTIGAVNPETDGNYFDCLIISARPERSGSILGLRGWWEDCVLTGMLTIDCEFPFDTQNVEIRELTLGGVV